MGMAPAMDVGMGLIESISIMLLLFYKLSPETNKNLWHCATPACSLPWQVHFRNRPNILRPLF